MSHDDHGLEEESEDLASQYPIPREEEYDMQYQEEPIHGLSLDGSGSRLVTGTRQGALGWWTFGGMKSGICRPSTTALMMEGESMLRKVIQNPRGGTCLAVPHDAQPQV
ncbi:hypothetical protein KIPB_004425 [Kipferlia bialata]|uniref:Uncharacterized protein n=1 Tax=Kipferlia bialata TaxID=797122 RepID=A0A9K3CV24_9EUKA|nr:hypothetical protein KIPB_004425 [Kipferlia bialata]|eukprot:g4425.t1